MKQRRLLIIDDSAHDREVVRRHLSRDQEYRYEVQEATNAEDGLRLLSKYAPDVVILDQHLGARTGNEVLLAMRQLGHLSTAVVFVSGRSSESWGRLEKDPLTLGADDYLMKEDMSGPQLRRALTNAITKASMRSLLEQSEKQLRGALDEVEQRMAFEGRLIGVVSHDLRTPLGTMAMGLELLRDEPLLSDQGKDVLARLRRTTEHMTSMVSQLLDLTRVRSSGSFPIVRQTIDLFAYLHQWVADMRATHPDRVIVVEDHGHGLGDFDPTALRQAFFNLISNALRHGLDDAPVLISIRGEDQFVRVVVRNEGPTIAEDLMSALFEPFMRSSKSKGLGLGLYITREILLVHGGEITVRSASGITEFEVALPRHGPQGSGAAH